MSQEVRTSQSAQLYHLLRILARSNPAIWDIIDPRDPIFRVGARDRAAELNPQPLPPRAKLRFVAEDTAVAVAQAIIAADLSGQDSAGLLQTITDELCPRPLKFPWPRKWPRPLEEVIDDVDPRVVASVQTQFGIVFESYAQGIADERLSAVFGEAADRLVITALENAQVEARLSTVTD